jgi:hypothetical protein
LTALRSRARPENVRSGERVISEGDVLKAVVRTESPETLTALGEVLRCEPGEQTEEALNRWEGELDKFFTQGDLAALLDVSVAWLKNFKPQLDVKYDYDRAGRWGPKLGLKSVL